MVGGGMKANDVAELPVPIELVTEKGPELPVLGMRTDMAASEDTVN